MTHLCNFCNSVRLHLGRCQTCGDFEFRIEEEEVQHCRVCGCHAYAPCWDDESGPCYWVEEGLCSACAAEAANVAAPAGGRD